MWDDRHFKMLQEKNPVIVQEKGGRWMINFTIQAFKHIGELGIGWEKRMEYGRLLPPPKYVDFTNTVSISRKSQIKHFNVHTIILKYVISIYS